MSGTNIERRRYLSLRSWLFGTTLMPITSGRDLVHGLLEETSITEAQARELVSLLGTNWSSLVREAKAITNKPRPPGLRS
ncbi:hypothetical protein [Mesorhizobium sp. B2-7-2]|uniref:hypothetical protein n=1 Tax=Mesorhizobium sp. B2-7-2 TaxID=2589908 RepID=UPI0011286688|nr:hypothetical protein [Mesorhizobium sp. B2-7-2]TPJ31533.1 hypothetical protein FJ425_01025 [Mesorhizobium sp. B2-7-2]